MTDAQAAARFEVALRWVKNRSFSSRLPFSPDSGALLRMYALYKQATVGDAPVQGPSRLNLEARAKWQAHSALRGLSRAQAQERYVQTLLELNRDARPHSAEHTAAIQQLQRELVADGSAPAAQCESLPSASLPTPASSSSSTFSSSPLLPCTSSSSFPSSPSSSPPLTLSDRRQSIKNANLQVACAPNRWDGWGYQDTFFSLEPETTGGGVRLHGGRYLPDGVLLPKLRAWLEDHFGVDFSMRTPCQDAVEVPPRARLPQFEAALRKACPGMRVEDSAASRLQHSHGHTAREIWELRFGRLARWVDLVAWPSSHDDVVAVVKLAHDAAGSVGLIPFGGGTSVSQALLCPTDQHDQERDVAKLLVSLDMREMASIKWVDPKSLLACVEAGAVGVELERTLGAYGLCLGHEPDSSEFSTLGGWIATRASGMRKNRYGNIEDLVQGVRAVLADGSTFQRTELGPRQSIGPDLQQLLMGSEGTLGVVTEAVVRLSPLPEVSVHGSFVFPSFAHGVGFMRALSSTRAFPASVRLMDNLQFQFGQVLKPEESSPWAQAKSQLAKWYALKHLGLDENNMVAATVLFEGSAAEVRSQQREVHRLAALYRGFSAGAEAGSKGYFLTYMIAYLRDFGFQFSVISESFETAVSWEQVLPLCRLVKQRVLRETLALGIAKAFVSCRVTQIYRTGACVYFYVGFKWRELEQNPIETFERVEAAAREEILAQGGNLSHHHGVGKLRARWLDGALSPAGMTALRAIKSTLDPTNIFAAGNLGLSHPKETSLSKQEGLSHPTRETSLSKQEVASKL